MIGSIYFTLSWLNSKETSPISRDQEDKETEHDAIKWDRDVIDNFI